MGQEHMNEMTVPSMTCIAHCHLYTIFKFLSQLIKRITLISYEDGFAFWILIILCKVLIKFQSSSLSKGVKLKWIDRWMLGKKVIP